jgi:hypothetical protein
MPHQSVRRYRSPRVKMTRLGVKSLQNRAWSAAEPVTLNYRRPLKTGNIVQTSVNALMARGEKETAVLPGDVSPITLRRVGSPVP